MICIVKIEQDVPTGWVIATDTHDARRQVEAVAAFDAEARRLAEHLYRTEYPQLGRHHLWGGYWMLVA